MLYELFVVMAAGISLWLLAFGGMEYCYKIFIKHRKNKSTALCFLLGLKKTTQKDIEYVLERGADPNYNDLPLLIAIKFFAKVELIDFLVQKGMNIHTCGLEKQSSLAVAIIYNNQKALSYLIKKGCDINYKLAKDGGDLLQICIYLRRYKLARYLLENYNFNPHYQNKLGQNSLMLACQVFRFNPVMIKTLLQYNFDLSVQDKKGKTVKDYCSENIFIKIFSKIGFIKI